MNRIFFLLVFSLLTSVAASARKLQVKPGNFKNLYNAYELIYEGELELLGSINGTDIKVLREWAAGWKTLNLKECRIVAGGEPYYEDYTTEDDVIGSYMFGDKELKKLILPKDLKKIGDYAITFCGDSMELPPTLTWLGDHAFVNNNFKQLHLPASLVHIGNGALNGNLWLNKVTIDEDNPEYVIEDGYLFTRDHTRLLAYFGKAAEEPVESFTIRPEVITIDDKAFYFHSAKNITLNEGLEHIGDEAFRLTLYQVWQPKLVIPNSVNHIGAFAFQQCYMDSLILSDNIEHLQEWSFAECFIDHIHLPTKLKHVGEYALCNNQLYDLVLPEGLERVDEHGFGDIRVNKLVIPSSVRYLAKNAFWNTFSDTIEIKAPLDSIPTGCFYNCESLRKLILPPTIKRIGGTAFYECYRLNDCKLPEGLEEIGVEALSGADGMVDWHIPASVNKIGYGAFFVPNYSAHNIYMYSQEPPAETDPGAFADAMRWKAWNMDESVLYVPEGCIENYQHQAPWCDFGTIKEFQSSSIKSVSRTLDYAKQRSYDIGGRPISDGQRGLRIMVTKDGVKKVIK